VAAIAVSYLVARKARCREVFTEG